MHDAPSPEQGRDRHPAGGAPALSVILVTPDHFATIRTTVRHLRAQTIGDRLELLIVAPSIAALAAPPGELEGFARCEVIEVGTITRIARAKLPAVRLATGPVVAFAEDHCFPAPTWAAALVAAHGAEWAAVGPAISNGNPGTRLSQAAFLLHWLQWAAPRPPGEMQYLPWHNTSYKRDVLLALGDRLPGLLASEASLQDELRANGQRLYLEAAARTTHVNVSRLTPWLGQGYWGGRLYGALRSARWPVGQRLFRAAAAPLVPVVRLSRMLRTIRRSPELRGLTPGVLPAVMLGLIVHAVGECAGYLAGVGPSEERYSTFEMGRARHLAASDRSTIAA
jgi:hypothetical protein